MEIRRGDSRRLSWPRVGMNEARNLDTGEPMGFGAGIGDVGGDIPEFLLKERKPTFRFGIRFALDPGQTVNVRADFGYGRDTRGVYFNSMEAF